jgi:hypothetical protein
VTTITGILRNSGPVLGLIQDGIKRVNQRAPSDAHKIIRAEILPADFSLVGGELGPTFRVQRLIVAKKVTILSHTNLLMFNCTLLIIVVRRPD